MLEIFNLEDVVINQKKFSYLNDKELKSFELTARDQGSRGILRDNQVLNSGLYKLGVILSPFMLCCDLKLICQQILEKKDNLKVNRIGKKVAVVDGCGSTTSIGLYLFYDDLDFYEEVEWPLDWENFVTIDFVKSKGFEIIIA